MVGTVTNLNGKWRLTTWWVNGPSGHTCFVSEKSLERELRREWREDPGAGILLEIWSNTPMWERGLKQCQIMQCWNSCSYHGRYDLAQRIDKAATLDAALAIVPEIMAELAKQIKEEA